MMLQLTGLLALCASGALASFANNLNYRSPSHNHPSLGINIQKVNKRNDPTAAFNPTDLNFTHGVASGDPYPNSVILWTRCSPMYDNVNDNSTVSGFVPLYNPVPIYGSQSYPTQRPSRAPVCLQYRVSPSEDFASVADQGQVYTSSDVDYTVKVEAQHLEPFTTYYYQFSVCGSQVSSPVGRTRTAPRKDDAVDNIRLAVYSCSNYPFGFFNAYGNPAIKDSVDYVLHLGDYIYEYGNGEYGWGNALDRIPQPDREIFTLYDYRRRHATYRVDSGLLASTQRFAWISVWDDHEVADNTFRDGASHLNNTEDSFVEISMGVSVDQRKMNAVRAYFEWMPIRQVDMDDGLRIWRSFQLGNLMDVIMLDTRQYDRSITDLYWNTDYVAEIANDAGRSLMGARQENWFYRNLRESNERGATWRIIGSQIIFSRINNSIAFGNEQPFNVDQWDGYRGNRNRTFDTLYTNNIGNNIFLAGDSHANWVSDVVWQDAASVGGSAPPYDQASGAGSVGVEFAGSAVSSPSPAGQNISMAIGQFGSQRLVEDNPELWWSELYYRGYFELHISHSQVNAMFFGMPTTLKQAPTELPLANFTVVSGENRLSRAGGVGGGVVESGYLRGGTALMSNVTQNVTDGTWFVHNETYVPPRD